MVVEGFLAFLSSLCFPVSLFLNLGPIFFNFLILIYWVMEIYTRRQAELTGWWKSDVGLKRSEKIFVCHILL